MFREIKEFFGSETLRIVRSYIKGGSCITRHPTYLHCNHKCMRCQISPKSLQVRRLINTKDGKVLAKKYGFQNLKLRIRSSHNKINWCNKEMEEQRQLLSKTWPNSTLAQLDSYLKVKLDNIFQYLNAKHIDYFFFFSASCSNHCLAALDLGAGVEQPFGCLIVQNRQAMQSMGRSIDLTLEDNMVDGLFFYATLTGRRGGHTPFVQAGTETSNTGAEAVKPNPLLGRVIPGGGYRCRRFKCGGVWDCPPTPHPIGDPSIAQHVCCCCLMNWWDVVRRVQMGVLIWGAVHLHSMDGWALSGADVQAPWHGALEAVRLHCDEAQQMGCLRELEGCPLVQDAGIQSQFARRRWWRGRWGGCEHCGTKQECLTLRSNAPGLRWLFAALLLQHPNRSQQTASTARCVHTFWRWWLAGQRWRCWTERAPEKIRVGRRSWSVVTGSVGIHERTRTGTRKNTSIDIWQ